MDNELKIWFKDELSSTPSETLLGPHKLETNEVDFVPQYPAPKRFSECYRLASTRLIYFTTDNRNNQKGYYLHNA